MEMHLGDGEADWFEESEIKEYREILKGRKDVYFRNTTTWGVDYTLARPICDSNGNYYGLLCADIAIDEVNTTIYRNIIINISVMIAAGILFIVLLIMWMRKNVTKPLKKLENSVTDFANSSAGLRDPNELKYISLQINTKNEVESLANAYEKLSINMKEYIKGIVEAEKEAKGLKKHVSEINAIAYHDALTHVKNKAAFDEKREEIANDIQNGNNQFGFVMADINSLKDINDKYGHEKGDEYIIGACKIICDIYAHSNVYRIGGDEFVVLLQGRDYENRESLLENARREFRLTMNDEKKHPWNRYSAAVGMAIYTDGDDVDKVFSHADHQMYENKKKIKETYKVL